MSPDSNESAYILILSGAPPGGISGFFEYSGAPALGNPPITWAVPPTVTSDPFGNPLPVSGGIATTGATGVVQLSAAAINFLLSGAVFGGAMVMTAPVPPSTGVPGVLLTSPSDINAAGANSQAALGLVGQAASGGAGPFIFLGSGQAGAANIQSVPVLVVGGNLAYAAPGVPGGALVAETWHHITTGAPAGWTIDIAYRFLAETGLVMVQVIASVAAGTAVTFAETIATLPAGPPSYQPSNGKGFDCAFFNGTVDSSQPFVIQAGGAIQYAGAGFTAGATAQFVGQVIFTTLI